MIVIDNIYSFIGLAMKAGKLMSGEQSCERMIKSGKAALVIIAGDASKNTKKRFTDMCHNRGINFRFFGERERLGRSLGKDPRSAAVILDKGFAERLMEMIGGQETESGGEPDGKSKGV